MSMGCSSSRHRCPVTQWPIQHVATTPCGHGFEAGPLLKWVERHHVCPLDYENCQESDLILPETFQRGVHSSSPANAPTSSSRIEDEDFLFQWYQKASQEGWVKAQVRLGECYTMGWGTSKNAKAAVHWFKRAAIQGNKAAQFYYGAHLRDVKDWKASVRWLQKSATQGNPYAQYQLSKCYRKGEGVDQSRNTAFHWLEKAAIQDLASAQRQLALEGGFPSLRQALFWLKRAADNGDAQAQHLMGNAHYFDKLGLEQSDSKAFDYYSLSAEQNYAPALFMAGWFMLGGHGVEPNPEGALVLIQAAADLGEPLAQQYFRGELCSKPANPESQPVAALSKDPSPLMAKGEPDDIDVADVMKYVIRESFISLLDFTQNVSISVDFKDFLPEPRDYLPEPWSRWIPSPSQWAPSIRVEPINAIRDRYLRKFDGNPQLAAYDALKDYRELRKWEFQSIATILAPTLLTSLLSGGFVTAFFMKELHHMWRELREISLVAAIYGHDTQDRIVQRRIFSCFVNANRHRLPFSFASSGADWFGVGYGSLVQFLANEVASFVPDRFFLRPVARNAVNFAGGYVDPQERIYEYALRRFGLSAQASAFAEVEFA